MSEAYQLLRQTMGRQDRRDLLRLLAKLFFGSLGILQGVEGIKTGLKARRHRISQALLRTLRSILAIKSTHLRTAIFVSLYPVLFRLLNVISPTPDLRSINTDAVQGDAEIFPSTFRFIAKFRKSSRIRAFLNPALPLGALAYLLPPGVLGQLNLYAVSVLGLALTRWTDKRVIRPALYEGDLDSHASGPSEMRGIQQSAKRLTLKRIARTVYDLFSHGGGWWLFALTQGYLLHLALFEPYAFSKNYRNGIIGRSSGYLPTEKSTQHLKGRHAQGTYAASLTPPIPSQTDLLHLIPRFSQHPHPHPLFPPPADLPARYLPFAPLFSLVMPPSFLASGAKIGRGTHDRLLCATMHPGEISCSINFIKAVLGAMPGAIGFIGGWGALSMLVSGRRKALQSPSEAVRRWVVSTARGSAFMTLAITSAWAWICAFQRILRPDQLPRLRFGLGGALAGLWILLVPSARRLELGMYCLRLSMAGAWKVGTRQGRWRYRESLSILPFAVSMAALTALHRSDEALVHGWVAKLLSWIDRRAIPEATG